MTINTQTAQEAVQDHQRLIIRQDISFVQYLDRASVYLNQFLALLAGCGLLLMVAVIVSNGVLRVVYKPFSGTTEVVGWLCALSSAFGLGYTQIHRGYVEIDVLVQHFPRGVQHVLKIIILIVCTTFFAIVSWQIALYGMNVARNGNLSETMGITFYPLIILVSLGFASLTLTLFVDSLKQLFAGRR
ncbi:MAG: TRAP transporter small permease [Dehalobacterium sp.]